MNLTRLPNTFRNSDTRNGNFRRQNADIEERVITHPMGKLIVKELMPSLRDDFLHFFDNIAFVDNPDWSDCYCSAYHFTNNKGAAPRSSYPGVQWLMGPGPDKYERVGSIVCFVIASTHRNQGVASQLLNAACNKFSQKGLEYAEAYPVKKPESAAYNFPGPLSMYLKNGFSTHQDADWYLVVRKRLKGMVV